MESLVMSTVVIGILAVFLVLMVLYVMFSFVEHIAGVQIKVKKLSSIKVEGKRNVCVVSGEEITAVISVVHLYMFSRDEESSILSIKHAPKMYSPWSSKIYSVYTNILKK